jgi:hypothetical protein
MRLILSSGATSISQSALDILVDLYLQHINVLAGSCQQHANLARRTQSNLDDVLFALNDTSIDLGGLTKLLESLDWNNLRGISVIPFVCS